MDKILMGDGLEQVECVTRDSAHSESHFNTGTQRSASDYDKRYQTRLCIHP